MTVEEARNIQAGDRFQKSKHLVWTALSDVNYLPNAGGYYVQANCGDISRSMSEEELLGFSLLRAQISS